MTDESFYSTNNEAALAVVATAMKKARLRFDVLMINSFVGALLFSSGGMLYTLAESYNYGLHESNPGILFFIQGLVFPIGLFYVVITGTDLFNSNVLFFSVGILRRAVSILDLITSWVISYIFNLVGNIFVCYIICHFSHVSQEQQFKQGSIDITMKKSSPSFVETLIRGMAGNFFVCLAVYLQFLARPLHVKFLLLLLPVFTFSSMGFTHCIADMYLLVMGLINGAPISVGKVVWKVMLPSAIGNMIGGFFFGLVIPWYLHIYSVERDQRSLRLPEFEARDEQPEINSDSRVVRKRVHVNDYEEVPELYPVKSENQDITSLSTDNHDSIYSPQQLYTYSSRNLDGLARVSSAVSGVSRFSTMSSYRNVKSPKNVFPVYGMGPPSEREKSIASGQNLDELADEPHTTPNSDNHNVEMSATYLGDYVKKLLETITGNKQKNKDLETQSNSHPPIGRQHSLTMNQSPTISRKHQSLNNHHGLNEKLDNTGITTKDAGSVIGTAGIPPMAIQQPRKLHSYKLKNANGKYDLLEDISPSSSDNHLGDSKLHTEDNKDNNRTEVPLQNSDQSSSNIINYHP